MTEEERVERAIRLEIQSYTCTVCMECAKAMAKKILAIKGIRIESDDQDMPDVEGKYGSLTATSCKNTQADMLRAGFVKCLPKKVK
jgi:hypothetical protein